MSNRDRLRSGRPDGWRAWWRAGMCLACLLVLLVPAATGCSGDTPAAGDDSAAAGEGGAAEAGEGPETKTEEASAGGTSEKKKKKKPRKERATSVTAAEVLRSDLVIPIQAEGSVRARHVTEVKFEIAGRIDRIWVREGQRVPKGRKLVGLDDREYRLSLEEANSRYLQSLGQLAVEEEGYGEEEPERVLGTQVDELRRMEDEGLITRRQRLDRELELGMDAVRDGAYRRELLEVRSGLAAARADAARAELDLERTVLQAPFAGVVTDLRRNPGERVQAGETLCRLVDDVNLEASLGVLESDLGALSPGRAALLTIPALRETLRLQVDVISPDIDEESRTCSVLMRLKSERGRVKPGMFVRASIAGRTLEDRLLVPREAIVTRDGRPVLFKVEGDRARWVYVQLGEQNDHLVEITRVDQGGPLEPGTLVVVDNHLTLTHEAKIKVKRTIPVTDPWTPAATEG